MPLYIVYAIFDRYNTEKGIAMSEINKTPQSNLEYERNYTSVPLGVGREAVNNAGVFGYVAMDSITAHFTPTDDEDFPEDLDRPNVVRSAE